MLTYHLLGADQHELPFIRVYYQIIYATPGGNIAQIIFELELSVNDIGYGKR